MSNPTARPRDGAATAVAGNAELEAALLRVEHHLEGLQAALGARDMPCLEEHAADLHKALQHALERFAQAARRGALPPLRRRLGPVVAQVAAQRDALARAGAALERAIGVLMPDPGATLYSHSGVQPPRRVGSTLQA